PTGPAETPGPPGPAESPGPTGPAETPGPTGDVEPAAGEPAEPAGGLAWRLAPGWAALMPGFSHGTAGVAFALAVASRALHRPDALAAARAGGRALIALGAHPTGWAVPNRIPPKGPVEEVSYGWCHGPTGTMRLFLALDELDPSADWAGAVTAGLDAVRSSGLPARLYPGFWDNLGRCCGTAGVGVMALERFAATGDRDWLDWADELAEDVLTRAVSDERGTRWFNTEHTRDPPELPPESEFMQGAAGIAAWLLRLAPRHPPPDAPAPAGVLDRLPW
ncbi:MAG: lanthionine synthetase LanC family protein, partial [Frankia sp.]